MDWWLLLSYVGVFALGVYVGYKINDWIIRKTFAEMMAEAGLSADKLDQFTEYWAKEMGEAVPGQTLPSLEIRVEKVGDQIFCYEKATDQFLAQAQDRDELIDKLTERLGPTTLQIREEDGAELVADPKP